ncbi:26804_t:CDS:2 [Gigaspora margarita]|uniref:26804_t:CDS:1 n=1 Tax=Gigaspora margarita TaxID=4874 RepID=A0ABN7VHK9_GIGMA|nr:26804_t:CDS:2 [Gigaspora margarita]
MSLTNLQNFALNILKETEHSTVQNINITELPPCSECDKKILSFNYEPFTILACGHMYHRYCIEKKILLTNSNVCPISGCNKSVEPAVSVQKEYESSQSSGTSDLANLLGGNLELDSPMITSPALGQKEPPPRDNDPILFESETQKKRLISELTTDVSEISKVNITYNENATNFLQLNDNITHVESKTESTNQELIRCYYSFGDALSKRLNYYKNLKHGDLASQALVNEEVREQIGEKISNDTLRKRTEKARKIYALFNSIFKDRGKEMIVRIKTFSASSISKLSWEEIEYVIARIIRSNQ